MNNNLENNIVFVPLRLRLASYAVDLFCLFIVFCIIVATEGAGLPSSNLPFIDSILYIFFAISMPSFFCAYNNSPGKKIFKLKLIDLKTGDFPSLSQCFLRSSVVTIIFCLIIGVTYSFQTPKGYLLLLVPFISIPFNNLRLEVHDIIAKTGVIYSNNTAKKLPNKSSFALDIMVFIIFTLLLLYLVFFVFIK